MSAVSSQVLVVFYCRVAHACIVLHTYYKKKRKEKLDEAWFSDAPLKISRETDNFGIRKSRAARVKVSVRKEKGGKNGNHKLASPTCAREDGGTVSFIATCAGVFNIALAADASAS